MLIVAMFANVKLFLLSHWQKKALFSIVLLNLLNRCCCLRVSRSEKVHDQAKAEQILML